MSLALRNYHMHLWTDYIILHENTLESTIFAKTGWHVFTFLYYMSILVYRNVKKSFPLPLFQSCCRIKA